MLFKFNTMKKSLFTTLFITIFFLISIQSNAQTYTLKFKTNYGNFKVMLYDFTPNHRDLILKEVEKGTYKKALFNRVIKNFVVQGGELDDVILEQEAKLNIEKPIRLAPEFNPKAFHKIGALGAGRDDNSTKGSFLNQIYFVVGKRVNEIDLELLEQKKGVKFTAEQRAEYLKNGGQPRLDHDYTIFGEITKGLPIIMNISKVDTDYTDLPEDPVIFTIKVKKNLPKKVKRTSISAGLGIGHR